MHIGHLLLVMVKAVRTLNYGYIKAFNVKVEDFRSDLIYKKTSL